MLRGLKITMSIFGAVLCIEGLLDIVFPAQRAEGMGLGQCASQARLPMLILGASWLVAGASTIAGARDPLRQLNLVKFALAFPLALLLVLVVAIARGYVPVQRVAIDIGFDALFFALFFIFYPRRARVGLHESSA
jgi:hypothetical protein